MFKITKEYDMDYRRLVYRPEEYSFDSIPIKNSDYYSILNLEQYTTTAKNISRN